MERKDRQSRADVLNFNGKVSHISIRTASKRGFRFEVLPVGTSCMDPVGAGTEIFNGGRKKA